jgi:hypothetical protein
LAGSWSIIELNRSAPGTPAEAACARAQAEARDTSPGLS